jgi:glutaconate CoA-transferase subunit A
VRFASLAQDRICLEEEKSVLTKVRQLEELVAEVPDGATVALGGLSMNSAPMALVRELVRQGRRDLTVVAIVAGMAVDWLVAGGCVRKVVSGLVSFEGFGLAPNFRTAVQSGEVEMEEYSEHLLICRLRAQAWNLPFVPTRAGLGTELLDLHRDSGTIREEVDSATGEHYVACTPLPLDVAFVHAHKADQLGNTRVEPKLIWMDNEIVNAAASTVVSVERLIGHTEFVSSPHRTTYPRFMVEGVCEARWGAYPTSLFPDYGYHSEFFSEYSTAARDVDAFKEFFAERVVEPPTWEAFLDANGGIDTCLAIRRQPA